jgi:CRP-like cAMP-binding protein
VLHDGREVARLNDGQVFGELADLDPESRLATVTAVADTQVFRLYNEVLEMLISAQPAAGLGIIRMLVQRIRAMGKATNKRNTSADDS